MTIRSWCSALQTHMQAHLRDTFRAAGEALEHPFLVPGSDQYAQQLWDWDSWLTNIAIAQAVDDCTDGSLSRADVQPYERGCIGNFVGITQRLNKWLGWMPVVVDRGGCDLPADPFTAPVHKPCLAQHAAFLVERAGGDSAWLREQDALYTMQALINFYQGHRLHRPSGLFVGDATGVDDDPTVHHRPRFSTAPVLLNCFMLVEMQALINLLRRARLEEAANQWQRDCDQLRAAIQDHCWDERDGFFYSQDVLLHAPDTGDWVHSGRPRHWPCLPLRIQLWTGFVALWAGVATDEQAARMVGHYRNTASFNCPAGLRTLSAQEPMYLIRASGNPSCWLGPTWGIANYLTWQGLRRYGYEAEARELCERTIGLFGRSLQEHGTLFEYYQPSNGEPMLNPGFQNWNQLVLNMIAWHDGRPVVSEFLGERA